MPTTYNGQLDSRGLRFAIGLARFNSFVTERLLEGALDAIARTGGDTDTVEVYRIPGAWELPVLVKRLAQQQRFDAILCLGAVVRGDTPHFEYVAGESARGLAHIALETGLPILNGVLTTNTLEQAIDRAGGKAGNKGFDAAMAAIEMAHLFRQMGEKGQP